MIIHLHHIFLLQFLLHAESQPPHLFFTEKLFICPKLDLCWIWHGFHEILTMGKHRGLIPRDNEENVFLPPLFQQRNWQAFLSMKTEHSGREPDDTLPSLLKHRGKGKFQPLHELGMQLQVTTKTRLLPSTSVTTVPWDQGEIWFPGVVCCQLNIYSLIILTGQSLPLYWCIMW